MKVRARSASASSLALLLAASLTLHAAPSAAQSPSDKAAAEALFDQGKKLLTAGRFAEACPKFAESNRLDSGTGTMLYLADCHEKLGLTASAWAEFREAASASARSGDPREKVARERASKLEPRLSHLAVTVSGTPPAGLQVTRDGEAIGAALLGTDLPTDPGTHTVTATAPGKKPWETSITLAPNGASVTVTVPALEDAAAAVAVDATGSSVGNSPAPLAPLESTPEASSRGNTQRIAGIAVAGVGVVGVVIGSIFGLKAKSNLDDSNANNHCHDGNLCDATGRAARDDAASAGTVSTVTFIVGGAALAGGAVLYFTAPKDGPRVGVSPMGAAGARGVFLHGEF